MTKDSILKNQTNPPASTPFLFKIKKQLMMDPYGTPPKRERRGSRREERGKAASSTDGAHTT